jgi:alpha-L-rhamnosidase
MIEKIKIVLTVLLIALLSSCNNTTNKCLPKHLLCEYLTNPIGVDTENPRLRWQISDKREGATQNAYKIIVGTDSEKVSNGSGDMWNTGKVADESTLVSYQGKPLQPFTKYYWTIQVWDKDKKESANSEVASFETGMMQMTNWKGSWISDTRDVDRKPAAYFRKEFEAKKKIIKAQAYIAVGGLYELYINGKRVGDHRLDPNYTRFDRRNLYLTHDVTDLLEKNNAVGVLLGNGWYNHQSTAVWFFHEAVWRARPKFCMDLRITYEDGTVETISTERNWKTSLSPVIFNSIYTAEHYDARLEQPGWDRAGFDDSKWKNSINTAAHSQNIVSQLMHPIRDVEQITPVSMRKVNSRKYVFDLGRTIAGVTKISLKGDAGTELRVTHSELIDDKGDIDLSNIIAHYRPTDDKDPFQTDIYTLKGKGVETFVPKFNYKGFQYVEVVSNKPINLTENSLTGIFMHSDVPPTGTINSSNNTLNKLWKATNSAYLSNLFGYPTDCPQREKNGWTGDAHIAIETGLYNFDGITVYEKWLADHRDEQQSNGVLPSIIPSSDWGYAWGNGPDWTSTIAIIPWNIYLFYGDTKLLADCYDNIKRYVDHISEISPEYITDWGLGDWVPVKSRTPKEFTSSIYYFVDATILSKTAKLLGNESDYVKYAELANNIKAAINKKYFNKDTGIYGSGFQTELSTALFWGIVPEESRKQVADNLAKKVVADGNHIDVGLLGSKAILNALSENGYADLAYKVASQETFPSWGWWIVNGATTLFEDWNMDKGRGAMSRNHIMFGEIGAWYYKALGGIKPDPSKPGFKNILLEPHFVDGLERFEAKHNSPYGEIVSSWKRSNSKVLYSVTIPANSTATLKLRAKNISDIGIEYDKELESGIYTLNLVSGTYEISIEE